MQVKISTLKVGDVCALVDGKWSAVTKITQSGELTAVAFGAEMTRWWKPEHESADVKYELIPAAEILAAYYELLEERNKIVEDINRHEY